MTKISYLDDAPIKAELDGVPFTEPGILAFLRELIFTGVASCAACHFITKYIYITLQERDTMPTVKSLEDLKETA